MAACQTTFLNFVALCGRVPTPWLRTAEDDVLFSSDTSCLSSSNTERPAVHEANVLGLPEGITSSPPGRPMSRFYPVRSADVSPLDDDHPLPGSRQVPRERLSALAASENQGINMFRLSHFHLHVPTATVLRWDPSGLIEWMQSPHSPRRNSRPDRTTLSAANGRAVARGASLPSPSPCGLARIGRKPCAAAVRISRPTWSSERPRSGQ